MTKCEFCGQAFASRRRDARFCGATCRSRAHRQGNGSGDGRPLKLLRSPAGDATDDEPVEPGPVERAAIAELTAAGRLYGSAAASALVLASRLDRPARETGSQLAALQKQFEAAMQAAMAESAAEPDFIDELKARIEAKRRAARGEPA